MVYEKILGSEHFAIMPPLNNLATIYIVQENYDLAENCLQCAVAIGKKTNHPQLLTSLSNLALLYGMQEKYSQAEVLNLEVVHILEKTPEVNPFLTLQHYEELSKIYVFTKQFGKSESYLKKALRIRTQDFASDQESIAVTLSNLGFVCVRQGEYAQAKRFYGDALELLKSIHYPDHFQVRLASYSYDAIIEKVNNTTIKISRGKNAPNSYKHSQRNKASSTQKSKKKKQRKRT